MNGSRQQVDKQRLARLLVDSGAVRFGEFTTKSERISPYFINLGAIHGGAQIAALAECYAQGIAEHFADERPDCLFGPAYKAIPLAVAAAVSAARLLGRPFSYSFNRKEATSSVSVYFRYRLPGWGLHTGSMIGPHGRSAPATRWPRTAHCALGNRQAAETYVNTAKQRSGQKGGKARAPSLTPDERSPIAQAVAVARWGPRGPRRGEPSG